MAVIAGKASFVARSTTASAADFTRRTGVEPTSSWEIGDPARQAGRLRTDAGWTLDRDLEVEGETLDRGLLRLVEEFAGREAAIRDLAQDYEMYVRCYASSDSGQGGFVLGAQVMWRMGELGLDLLCTLYLDDDAGAVVPDPGTS